MLRINLLARAFCVAVVCVSLASAASAVDVNFPDANLEAAVRDELGIPAPTPITDTDMETMGTFDASYSSISNIQGLEYATNLTGLELYDNQINDITPVSGLMNLTSLGLDENQIIDITAVSGLTNLGYLRLDFNQIIDITAVSGLTNLTELWLIANQIIDITAVSGLTNLDYLDLGYNQISDISAVSGLTNLTCLILKNNQISDITAVSGLTNLGNLHLRNNQIEIMNLSNSDLSSLGYFDIGGNPLTNVLLGDATLSQSVFNTLMDGGYFGTGIAGLSGVLSLDMGGVDFVGILDFSKMYTMNDLETLLLAGASNLDGSEVVLLTGELDSLNWLDVTGLWDSFDAGAQGSLNTWDAVPGNTLVIPEPATLSLLALGGLAMLRRRQKA